VLQSKMQHCNTITATSQGQVASSAGKLRQAEKRSTTAIELQLCVSNHTSGSYLRNINYHVLYLCPVHRVRVACPAKWSKSALLQVTTHHS